MAALVSIVVLAGCSPLTGAVTPTSGASESATTSAEVVAVVDGDTIDVATSAGTARVRLIGIDTPEIGRGGEPSECYAQEARTFLDELLYGHEVDLVSDPTQADVDQYGRLLRYVLIDGRSAAELAIAAGAGYEYTYDTAYRDQQAHLAEERSAANARAGLWGACQGT